MKKRLTKERATAKHRHGGKKQLQSRDVFVKYKHNLVGVKEQIN
jgi:hypothetical protein